MESVGPLIGQNGKTTTTEREESLNAREAQIWEAGSLQDPQSLWQGRTDLVDNQMASPLLCTTHPALEVSDPTLSWDVQEQQRWADPHQILYKPSSHLRRHLLVRIIPLKLGVQATMMCHTRIWVSVAVQAK